jgi:ABC-type multidrug transport system fused ATPase/permease subunit
VQAITGILRHRRAIANWMTAGTKVQQLLARHAAAVGGDLPKQVATGEIVAVSANDVERIGGTVDVIPRLVGALIAFVTVATILIHASWQLGLIVICGVPILALGVGPLIKPLQAREAEQRKRLGKTTELASDTVAGLRVLRGIGGEELFVERFVDSSQSVREAAVKTARVRSLVDAMQVFLPGAFILGMMWGGAHLVLRGHLTIGQLIAFYGYSAFLVIPLRTLTEAARKWTSGWVAMRRLIRVLTLSRERTEPANCVPASSLDLTADLVDEISGVRIPAGVLTAIACDDPDTADEIAERLGGYRAEAGTHLGSTPLENLSDATLRTTVLVQDKDPVLLSGTLAALFDVPRTGRVEVEAALAAASAQDILDSLDGEGMRAVLVERGRTLSGGQRQRLALARSLVADPAILVLDEPTSAVDAHTEARIASSVGAVRAGKTTVAFTTSPLLLDKADHVVFVKDGQAVDAGTHAHLAASNTDYRRVVVRDIS